VCDRFRFDERSRYHAAKQLVWRSNTEFRGLVCHQRVVRNKKDITRVLPSSAVKSGEAAPLQLGNRPGDGGEHNVLMRVHRPAKP
jgi:hypothetical protein